MRPADAAQYGRIVQDKHGFLKKIVEYKDATLQEKDIGLCNAGIMRINAQTLRSLLPHLTTTNEGSEYYLTDIVHLARKENILCQVIEVDPLAVTGINTMVELAEAEPAM